MSMMRQKNLSNIINKERKTTQAVLKFQVIKIQQINNI